MLNNCGSHSSGRGYMPRLAASLATVAALLLAGLLTLPSLPSQHGAPSAFAHAQPGNAADQRALHVAHRAIDRVGEDINARLNLLHSDLRQLKTPTMPQSGESVVIELPQPPEWMHGFAGLTHATLELWPHAPVAEDFRVRAQVEGGALVDVDVPPLRTLRGRVLEMPGATVAASLLDDGLHAMILMPDGEKVWIQPASSHVVGVDQSLHVVYRSQDIRSDGVCGGNLVPPGMAEPPPAEGGVAGEADDEGGVAGEGTIIKCVKLAIDADFQYYQQHGSSTSQVIAAITTIVNASNVQYSNQTGIEHHITEIVIRTSNTENPYSTNDPSTLLSQFRVKWNSLPEWHIDRNVAHLFTGRNLSGSVIGIAYLNVMCQKTWAYGISQNISGFGFKTDLFSHELGHNWSAGHCSCPNFTMNPSLTGANNFNTFSINQITSKLNSVSCPVPCGEIPPPGPQPPANNTCQGSALVQVGVTNFHNDLATTSGPAEPNKCNFDGETQLKSDVWFRHTATCTGDLTVSFCDEGGVAGADFDTQIALYGAMCPQSSGSAVACDDNSCGSTQASVTIPVNAGQIIRIRIGSKDGTYGEGAFAIACEPATPMDPCPPDLNKDGKVDGLDLLMLLGEWGDCSNPSNCPADLNNDGTVDGMDLLLLLGDWGGCP